MAGTGARVPLQTTLYERHAEAGATFTDFAGYEMPVHYGSIKEEHFAVRQEVGLFDVSHMSNVMVSGPGAAAALSAVMPKDMSTLPQGVGRYSAFLRDDGTILDDTYVFRLGPEAFMTIPNAGQNKRALEHLEANAPGPVELEDASAEWAILALQGPNAHAVLAALGLEVPRKNRIVAGKIARRDVWISGTGYTGEAGVEIFAASADATPIWDAILAAGSEHNIQPIGLGARDTLRLEKGYCLAGNEFASRRTPLEANLAWLVDWDHDFVGKQALLAQQGQSYSKLIGIVLDEGLPRPGYEVHADGNTAGTITSGTLSPSLGKGIALAFLRNVRIGDEVAVDIRGRAKAGKAAAPPFV